MNSSFHIFTSTIDKQLANIKKNIYLHKNGIISESMENKGIHYAKNYGVSIPELKNMATSLPQDALLAQRLWDENIRETKLLATYLYPIDKMNEETAAIWLKDINNIELAEQTARNLFSKSPSAASIANNLSQSTNKWQCSIGLMTAAYCMASLPSNIRSTIDQHAYATIKYPDYEIYWSVALYLKKRGACDSNTATEILEHISQLKNSTIMHEKYIFEEVSTELHYRFES
jgi:3-methyladenine DNA glycosylase AlkD